MLEAIVAKKFKQGICDKKIKLFSQNGENSTQKNH